MLFVGRVKAAVERKQRLNVKGKTKEVEHAMVRKVVVLVAANNELKRRRKV